MNKLEDANPVAANAHYTKTEGTNNRDPEA